MIFIAILAFVFGLGLIICIHEFGHFIFAKRAGILCYEFSIGMGPAIYRKKKGETVYAIRAIPIGGYVSMAGEQIADSLIREDQEIGLNFTDNIVTEIILDPDEEAMTKGFVVSSDLYDAEGNGLYIELKTEEEVKKYLVAKDAFYVQPGSGNREWRKMQIAPYERSFESKKLLPRFLSISFGPIMNFLLAIVLYMIVGLCVGKADMSKTVIGEASGPSASLIAGTNEQKIMKNDQIIEIEGVEVNNWNELSNRLDELCGNNSIEVKLLREGYSSPITVAINPIMMAANLGIYGSSDMDTTYGVPVYLYMINAKDAGLQNGDLVKSVNGTMVASLGDIINICKDLNGGKVEVVVDRALRDDNGEIIFEGTTPTYKEKDKIITIEIFEDNLLTNQGVKRVDHKIGISPKMKFDPLYAIGYGFTGTWGTFTQVFGTLGLLFTSKQVGVGDLSGPVGIFSLVENTVRLGLVNYISLIAMLSVNIGIINLLPIPALDGGRLVFLAYEGITRRKPNRKFENILNTIVFVLLMVLFVYITFNDILRLG